MWIKLPLVLSRSEFLNSGISTLNQIRNDQKCHGVAKKVITFYCVLELNRIWSERHKIGFVDLRGCRTLSVLRPTSLFLVTDSICHRKGYKTNFYNCAKCRSHFPLCCSFQQETNIKRLIHISHPIQKNANMIKTSWTWDSHSSHKRNTSGIWPSDTSGEYTGWMHIQGLKVSQASNEEYIGSMQTDWARVIRQFTNDNTRCAR